MAKPITPVFRVSYPNVFKARRNEMNGKDEFSLTALFKKGEDLSALKKAAEQAAIDKWGSDKAKWPKNLKNPFRDQADREKDGSLPAGYEAGAIYMNLKTTTRPQVVDKDKSEILDSSDFYAGCYARASISPFAYDVNGNRGISFGLGNIQKVKDGDALGGRTTAQADFEPITEDESTKEAGSLFS